jgi:hypothetical protein
MALTAKQAPYTGPYSVEGYGKHKGKTALALKRAMSRIGLLDWEPDKWDEAFNKKLEAALDQWDKGKDGYAEGRWLKLRKTNVPAGLPHAGEPALDVAAQQLIQAEAVATVIVVPSLGPIYNGGASILIHDLTHETDGVDFYPAFDDAFARGTGIIAPERLTVFQSSSSNPGHAFYCLGVSQLRYWFGHLDRDQPIGRVFQRGDLLGKVAANSVGGGPHCHCGVNVELLWGIGKQLAHRDSYTHGAPLIGDQLRAHAKAA